MVWMRKAFRRLFGPNAAANMDEKPVQCDDEGEAGAEPPDPAGNFNGADSGCDWEEEDIFGWGFDLDEEGFPEVGGPVAGGTRQELTLLERQML